MYVILHIMVDKIAEYTRSKKASSHNIFLFRLELQIPTLLATDSELKLAKRSPEIAAEMLVTKVVEIRLNSGTFSHGFAREFDGVRSMYQTIEDGIGQCWVGHGLVPCING
jgi:hypothetical protein